MDQFGGLVLNRLDYLRMTMPCRGHGNTCREVEKLVAVHIFHANAAAAFGDHGVGAGVAGRDEPVISSDNALCVWAGKRAIELWAVFGQNVWSKGGLRTILHKFLLRAG